jgi:Divergent InlB B-repeat domain
MLPRLALLLVISSFATLSHAAFTVATTTLGGGTVGTAPLSNSWVNVTATAAPGWKFLYWLGDASGSNPSVSLDLTKKKSVQAVFGTQLTATPVIFTDPQLDFYPYGTLIKMTCLPSAGTYFAQWSGDAVGTNNPLSFTVTNANPTVSSLLGSLSASQVSLAVAEVGPGRVTASPSANPYSAGQPVVLTANPKPGQSFVAWSGDTNSTANPIQVTLNQSKVITATFTKRPTLRATTSLEGLADNGFRFSLIGYPGVSYLVLGSTNLSDWTALGTVANTYGVVQFTDPTATNWPRSFYRSQNLAGYSVTLKNLGDTNAVVSAGTAVLVEPSNLGQTTAAFTVLPLTQSLVTLQNISDTPSNTVPGGTSLIPVNNIGTTASIFTGVQGQSTTIPLMAALPAPFNTRSSFHAFIGGYGFTIQLAAGSQTNVPAIADFWPAYQVWFNSPQSLLLDLNPPASLGHTADAFQVPATNKTVQISVPDWAGATNSVLLMGERTYAVAAAAQQSVAVSLSIPFAGAAGTDVLIGGSTFHVDRFNPTNSTISVFANPSGLAGGAVVPPGTLVSSTNSTASFSIGNVLGQFAVPALNRTVSVTLDQAFTGQTNQVLWINQSAYLVLSAGGGH